MTNRVEINFKVQEFATQKSLNFCLNPRCEDFGNEDTITYKKLNKNLRGVCETCGEAFQKINTEAVMRFAKQSNGERYLNRLDMERNACRNEQCKNFAHPLGDFPKLYKKNGKNSAGSQKYQCKSCKSNFAIPLHEHQYLKDSESHKNKMIFGSLIHGLGIRRIAYLNEISPQTVYDKLHFFWEKCVMFNLFYEQKIKALKKSKLFISTDSIHLTTNWRVRNRAHNKLQSGNMLKLTATCDNHSGFCLAQTVDFDSSVKSKEINDFAVKTDEFNKLQCERRYPEYIYYREAEDYEKITQTIPRKLEKQFDAYGIKVSPNYAYIAHFQKLNWLLPNIKRIASFADNNSLNQSTVKRVFKARIEQDTFRGYTLSLGYHEKGKNKKEMEREQRAIKNAFEMLCCKDKKFNQLISSIEFIEDKQEKLEAEEQLKKLGDKIGVKHVEHLFKELCDVGEWVSHPNPHKYEPKKEVRCDTHGEFIANTKTVGEEIYYSSNWAVDNYFQKLRKLSFFSRAVKRASGSTAADWKIDKSYDPNKLLLMSEIFKTYHNFIAKGKDGKTPAMRLGLTKKVWSVNEVLYKRY